MINETLMQITHRLKKRGYNDKEAIKIAREKIKNEEREESNFLIRREKRHKENENIDFKITTNERRFK